MSDGPWPSGRAWAAAGIFLVLLIAGLLISRGGERTQEAPPITAPTPQASPQTVVPQPLPPLSRAELIKAAQQMAASTASGEVPPASDLPGRRFVLRLPFGCGGPAGDLAEVPAGWSYDEENQILRAKVTPATWEGAPFLAAIAGGTDFEAAEGFWIDRPWQLSDTCPAAPALPSDEQGPSRQTLAIVQLFEPGTKRAEQRNGRPYEAVRKLSPSLLALDQGLRLVIEGRVAQFGNGRAIGCWNEAAELRPICAVRARFDRVAITDASGEHVLAEWKS